MKKSLASLFLLSFLCGNGAWAIDNALVLQSDFGLGDGAVSAMQGVAFGVDRELKIFNLTHEIPAYDVWAAAYRLYQTAEYWPKGTVFVSVVDPGVGSERKSVVLKTKNDQYFVSPDNGTLTLVADKFGIEEVREIDEHTNRLKGSEKSYTFHGRDVYAYTGARLASGLIAFTEVGGKLANKVYELNYQKAEENKGIIKGNIPILDVQYGNVWTNIPSTMLKEANITKGDTVCVNIYQNQSQKYSGQMPFVDTFSGVKEGSPLLYLNSLMNVALALNMGDFASTYNIASGNAWNIELEKCQANQVKEADNNASTQEAALPIAISQTVVAIVPEEQTPPATNENSTKEENISDQNLSINKNLTVESENNQLTIDSAQPANEGNTTDDLVQAVQN